MEEIVRCVKIKTHTGHSKTKLFLLRHCLKKERKKGRKQNKRNRNRKADDL